MTRLPWIPGALLALPLGLACGCKAPSLDALAPQPAFPRQIVEAVGAPHGARAAWDAGLPSEALLPQGGLDGRWVQVPETATAGAHPVVLRNEHGDSATLDLEVLPPSGSFPAPRIRDVGVLLARPAGSGLADLLLTVSAANLDVEAELVVDGTTVTPRVLWGVIPSATIAERIPATLGEPVYHYAQLVGGLEKVALDAELEVRVVNTDGQEDVVSYALPATLEELDGDGDGLLDVWETDGYPAPSGATIDLAALGCSPARKDVIVEVDWMAGATPDPAVWEQATAFFAEAPVLNPDGSRGIGLIVDSGGAGRPKGGGEVLADKKYLDFYGTPPGFPPGEYADFFDLKAAHFDPDWLELAHYCVFGIERPSTEASSGAAEIWGNDFYVTLVEIALPGGVSELQAQTGTFLHELGHNLGLRHGGIDDASFDRDVRHKPNLPSLMNYRWQLAGVSTDCDLESDGAFAYSEGLLETINEFDVDEWIGICDGKPLDLNDDGALSTGHFDVSQDESKFDVHHDFDQWGALRLDFTHPDSSWKGN